MWWMLGIGWLVVGLFSWWLLEEATLIEYGKVDVDDRLFFSSLTLMGPVALIVALLTRASARGSDRILRTRGQDELIHEPPPLAESGQVGRMLGLDPERWCQTHKRFGRGPYCAACVCDVDGCLGALNDCCVMVDAECEHCDECGRAYCDVYALPDLVWARIHERAPGGLLCPTCALRRLVAAMVNS